MEITNSFVIRSVLKSGLPSKRVIEHNGSTVFTNRGEAIDAADRLLCYKSLRCVVVPTSKHALLRTPLKTKEDAVAFIWMLGELGLTFHFDDSPETIINVRSQERIFTDEEVPHVRERVGECFKLLEDPFKWLLLVDGD